MNRFLVIFSLLFISVTAAQHEALAGPQKCEVCFESSDEAAGEAAGAKGAFGLTCPDGHFACGHCINGEVSAEENKVIFREGLRCSFVDGKKKRCIHHFPLGELTQFLGGDV